MIAKGRREKVLFYFPKGARAKRRPESALFSAGYAEWSVS
jgi:hypothetical protein